MKYNPALDGVRAISVIIVVAFHTKFAFAKGGMIGVDVFFVLSGFLITSILRNELQASGTIDLSRFYFRRAVRLMPPLILSMAGVYIGSRVFFPNVDILPDVVLALLYVSDYGKAFWGVPELIAHTWSLSVEEHFYLVWPLFLLATSRLSDRTLLHIMLAMFVAATAWRIADGLIWEDWTRTYFRFDTHMSGMILGAILAVKQWKLQTDTAQLVGKFSLCALAILVIGLRWRYMPSLLVGEFVAEVSAAGLIVSLTCGHQTAVSKTLSYPPLVYLGVLSYSIYLWHYGIAIVLREILDPVSAFAITLSASVVIAALSNKYVETPLRSWAHRSSKVWHKTLPGQAYANAK